jgi:hypothetical protein
VLLFWIHFAFPLVVDTCVLQPPIATSGETASASQVLPKGPVVRACWCIVRVEPWVCPCAKSWFQGTKLTQRIVGSAWKLPERSSLVLIPMKVVNERGVVVETTSHPINGKYGRVGRGGRLSAQISLVDRFSCKSHTDLRLCLTKECIHSLIEEEEDENP